MTRAAYIMDRLMASVGLSGRSFIPLLSSFACAIPGIMATRSISDANDRLTTILIAPLMTCAARLPVYAIIIGAFIPNTNVGGGYWIAGAGSVRTVHFWHCWRDAGCASSQTDGHCGTQCGIPDGNAQISDAADQGHSDWSLAAGMDIPETGWHDHLCRNCSALAVAHLSAGS